MNRYIKIKGYDEWFLDFTSLSPVEAITLTEKMSDKLLTRVMGSVHNPGDPGPFDVIAEIAARGVNYAASQAKTDLPIIIRERGTFMLLLPSMEITHDVIRKTFPKKKGDFAQVVVCENDPTLDRYWLHYFQRKYPGKTISVINYFRSRTDDDVREYFEKAEYVVFTTTFTSMDWWELLVRNLQPHNIVEGVSANDEGWEEAWTIYPKAKRLD